MRPIEATPDALPAGNLEREAESPGGLKDDAPLATGVDLARVPGFNGMVAAHALQADTAPHGVRAEVAFVMPHRVPREVRP